MLHLGGCRAVHRGRESGKEYRNSDDAARTQKRGGQPATGTAITVRVTVDPGQTLLGDMAVNGHSVDVYPGRNGSLGGPNLSRQAGSGPVDVSGATVSVTWEVATGALDSDPAINPNAAELPGNVVDENCDGALDCDPCAVWRNHGHYVSCVAHAVDVLVDAGDLTTEEGDDLVNTAARSDVGKKDFVPDECP